jgi:hypothetical protein
LIKCRLKQAGHQNLRRQNASILLHGIANGMIEKRLGSLATFYFFAMDESLLVANIIKLLTEVTIIQDLTEQILNLIKSKPQKIGHIE